MKSKLHSLAERIKPVTGWTDLLLPAAQKRALKEIVIHIKKHGKAGEEKAGKKELQLPGISALFFGATGTAQAAAEALANELRSDLYKIDLGKVVSKYIGETEKNLKQIFDASEKGGAILFFDEADALFGKRSEVKDSHDRYANIEINYLLQRIENYDGLVILATNRKAALDKPFIRRIRFVIKF